jgi:hypothetical protein
VLSDSERRLFARQVLLPELGLAGQQRLCASVVAIVAGADARAAAIAREYLTRAGVAVAAEPAAAEGGGSSPTRADLVWAASEAEVKALAVCAPLEGCAAWLAGAFAAVQAIKHNAGIAAPLRLDPDYRLGGED